VISACVSEPHFACAIIGGSVVKGQADSDSDVDLSIVCSDDVTSNILQHIQTKCHTIFLTQDRYGVQVAVQLDDGLVLDVHLIQNSICHELVACFNKGIDLSNRTQDFLWNISSGKRCFCSGVSPEYKITYSNEIRFNLLKRYRPLLSTHKLDVHFSRGDIMQQWETLLNISKVLVNVGYALNKELFNGYKHIQHRLSNWPGQLQLTLTTLMSFNQLNWRDAYSTFVNQLENVAVLVDKELLSLQKYGEDTVTF
jgi:hypothetical protein